MAAIIDPARADDAPPATSKHSSAAVDAVTEALIDRTGRHRDGSGSIWKRLYLEEISHDRPQVRAGN